MKITNPEELSPNGIKNIVFDWGGVITNLDFTIANNAFEQLGIKDVASYFSSTSDRFLFDFEVAKISPKVFRSKIRELTKTVVSDSEIDSAWNSLLRDTPKERIEVIQKLAKKYRVFLLSNTNAIHANYYNARLRKEYGVDHNSLFEKVYYSHELKQRKPGTEIFRLMLKDAKLIAEETLFVDDMEPNVDASASLGIRSFHLKPDLDISTEFKNW